MIYEQRQIPHCSPNIDALTSSVEPLWDIERLHGRGVRHVFGLWRCFGNPPFSLLADSSSGCQFLAIEPAMKPMFEVLRYRRRDTIIYKVAAFLAYHELYSKAKVPRVRFGF